MHAYHTEPHFELLISPEVMGCTTSTLETPEGWGVGVIYVFKNWKFRVGEAGGSCMKFPPRWGYGYILELHKQSSHSSSSHNRLIEVK